MRQIKLTAILRAYSKSSFHNDFVRDQEQPSLNVEYVRKYTEINDNGQIIKKKEWVPLNESQLSNQLSNNFKELEAKFDINPKSNTYVQRDAQGRIKSDIPESLDDVVNLNYLQDENNPINTKIKEQQNIIELQEEDIKNLKENQVKNKSENGQFIQGDLTIDGDFTVTKNLTIDGDLNVKGTTTTVNHKTLNVEDNILILNNKLKTSLSGIVINNEIEDNSYVYGIVYNPEIESVVLGKGSINDEGDFKINLGESNPLLTRDDSQNLEDNNLLIWDANSKKAINGKLYTSLLNSLNLTIKSIKENQTLCLNETNTITSQDIKINLDQVDGLKSKLNALGKYIDDLNELIGQSDNIDEGELDIITLTNI